MIKDFAFLIMLAFKPSVDAGLTNPKISTDLTGVSLAGAGDPFYGMDPEMSWKASASLGQIEIETGATASLQPNRDLIDLPRKVWAKASSELGGWSFSTKTSVDFQRSNALTYDIITGNSDLDTSIQLVTNSKGKRMAQLYKGIAIGNNRLSINPRIGNTVENDVILSYDKADGTTFTVEASSSNQKLSISQKLSKKDRITPSITSKGDLACVWRRSLHKGNSVTTTVKVNESVNIRWNDGPWIATIDTPLNGLTTERIRVKVKRKLLFD